jgi:hypothetical protein
MAAEDSLSLHFFFARGDYRDCGSVGSAPVWKVLAISS